MARAEIKSIMEEPLSTSSPDFIHVHNRILPDINPLYGSIKSPIPTNAWYTNVVEDSLPLALFPYILHPLVDGGYLCYPEIEVGPTATLSAQRHDLTFWSDGLLSRTTVGASELGIVTQWKGVDPAGPVLTMPLVLGSPYITMEYKSNGLPLNFTTDRGFEITAINHVAPTEKEMKGSKFVITVDALRSNDPSHDYPPSRTWVLYSLSGDFSFSYFKEEFAAGSSRGRFLIYDGGPLTVLRLAVITTKESESLLDKYAPVIVTGGDVSVHFESDTTPSTDHGYISLDWNTASWDGTKVAPTTGATPVMFALPHHIQSLDLSSPSPLAATASLLRPDEDPATTAPLPLTKVLEGAYTGIRGPLTAFAGSKWVLKEPLTNITWYSLEGIPEYRKKGVVYGLGRDVKDLVQISNDTYSNGKFVAALARLILIADEVGEVETMNIFLERLKPIMDKWMTRVTYRDTFLYDMTYGSIISANGWTNSGQDYGNGMFNDHHFHYGYYIYAASVLLRNDPQWVHKDKMIDLIRDIANPSVKDPYFPVTRHKDWFLGHSWAQGLDPTMDGKNQESTSEAVNAYYAIHLFGLAIGDQRLSDWGRLLTATEIRSTHTYWQIKPDTVVYTPPFRENTVVGILWSLKADYATFFGANPEFIHCIQMLPFTPITEELLPQDWVQVEYPVLAPVLKRPRASAIEEEWKAYVYEDLAIIDPDAAWKAVQFIKPQAFQGGNTRTNMFWWVGTRSPQTAPDSFSAEDDTFETDRDLEGTQW
eukprot:TRINITY_DN3731_c0_g1_i1.p1 TRINITY_DN3731_c0_g1~~TRINITY_DN3731_c0_g1_i1.p1  ORF type:complete len:815 (+),score=133.38 TRINITY_DN3731_c0_g1_i1:158-2446(+)